MRDLSSLRIVEIGNRPYLKQALPDHVSYFATWGDEGEARMAGAESSVVSLSTLGALWRALHEPETSLVVCHPTFFSPWHWRWLARVLFDRRTLKRLLSFPRTVAPQLLRWPIRLPVVIWDHADLPLINANNFFLLDRCLLYFKRELPPDRWRVFMKTGHANLPTARFRNLARYRARIDKLRPISIGLPYTAPKPFPALPAEKSTDIFFAGTVEGSSFLRKKGLVELLALRQRGFVVDIPDRRLPRTEFYRRCAQALLTWSPEGHGWECFRHYEAGMCGSVPLLNRPTIERYQPLMQGEHAIYYDVEEGELTRTVVAALADKPRLEAMGRAAQAHVLAHHTPEAIARYIIHTSLEMVWPSTVGPDNLRDEGKRFVPSPAMEPADVTAAGLIGKYQTGSN